MFLRLPAREQPWSTRGQEEDPCQTQADSWGCRGDWRLAGRRSGPSGFLEQAHYQETDLILVDRIPGYAKERVGWVGAHSEGVAAWNVERSWVAVDEGDSIPQERSRLHGSGNTHSRPLSRRGDFVWIRDRMQEALPAGTAIVDGEEMSMTKGRRYLLYTGSVMTSGILKSEWSAFICNETHGNPCEGWGRFSVCLVSLPSARPKGAKRVDFSGGYGSRRCTTMR